MSARQRWFLAFSFSLISFFLVFKHLLDAPLISISARQIEVVKGDSLSDVIHKLSLDEGTKLVPGLGIKLYFYLMGDERSIKTGFYQLPLAFSISYLHQKLTRGDVVSDCFTVIEGKTTKEVIKVLAKMPGMKGSDGLEKNWQDYLKQQGKVFEGQLLADTYCFKRGEQALNILMRSHQALERLLNEKMNAQPLGVKRYSKAQYLTLASLIEKESGHDNERALISSVIWNRLARNMRLQIDSSVIYGLGGQKLNHQVKRKLAKITAYNTYRNKGLPPTPIANVGVKSIDAAFNPNKTDYYYFVLDKGTKSHLFSKTYQEHMRHIKRMKKG